MATEQDRIITALARKLDYLEFTVNVLARILREKGLVTCDEADETAAKMASRIVH